MKRNVILLSLVFLFFATLIELGLRILFGFGYPPLYISDDQFEYIQAPNQNLIRFGNKYLVNGYSMRSKPLKNKDSINILGLGDSVLNGGVLTTHDSLATSLLENRFSLDFDTNIRVLNVSAGSWGTDNAMAYLDKYGDFNASLIFLVISSHDLYDVMDFQPVVGNHLSYPEKKPLFAIQELVYRYLIPRIKRYLKLDLSDDFKLGINQKSKVINPGHQAIIDYCNLKEIPLLVYLHSEIGELENHEYNDNGKKTIDLLNHRNVKFISSLNTPMDKSCYRDFIHLNEKGQRILAESLYLGIRPHLDSIVGN
ncbi:hypothetical protein Q4534_23325 [Cyclobacterium sp. 1_MG-2023]|uniref:hypothetical protein n=1 Tax=Cyclobacterium sp. 1_MG-2023 TaxID=3062681 RepID=UPI0026E366DB|nr:hypothetical protein [Cyclobacterium sp. 1_MG-2023]MDO6440378.1 hypothetical protein [Cyclobacterium sp. 1_MG-2023]